MSDGKGGKARVPKSYIKEAKKHGYKETKEKLLRCQDWLGV